MQRFAQHEFHVQCASFGIFTQAAVQSLHGVAFFTVNVTAAAAKVLELQLKVVLQTEKKKEEERSK